MRKLDDWRLRPLRMSCSDSRTSGSKRKRSCKGSEMALKRRRGSGGSSSCRSQWNNRTWANLPQSEKPKNIRDQVGRWNSRRSTNSCKEMIAEMKWSRWTIRTTAELLVQRDSIQPTNNRYPKLIPIICPRPWFMLLLWSRAIPARMQSWNTVMNSSARRQSSSNAERATGWRSMCRNWSRNIRSLFLSWMSGSRFISWDQPGSISNSNFSRSWSGLEVVSKDLTSTSQRITENFKGS